MKSTTMMELVLFLSLGIQLFHFTTSFNCDQCKNANICDTITGNFRITVMAKGYHPVVKVPRGACNINITELGDTINVLALKDVHKDRYVFNGDWLMDGEGTYPAVGAMVSYIKGGQNCPGECIRATGPTLGPVIVQLLYHERNPGVTFRYQLPKRLKDIPALDEIEENDRKELRESEGAYETIPDEEDNTIGTFPKFVPLPGPSGIHHRGPIFSSDFKYRRQRTKIRGNRGNERSALEARRNRQSLTDVTYSRGVDDATARKETSNEIDEIPGLTSELKTMNNLNSIEGSGEEIPIIDDVYEWTLSHHTNCSRICGGGIMQEVYQCTKIQDGSVVEDTLCSLSEVPEARHKVCNAEPCTPQWKTEKWSECSVSCGQGVQSRDVVCEQRISAIDSQELEEMHCGNTKPAGRKLCYADSCYSWFMGDWSECSVTCGRGQSNRVVECRDRSNTTVNDSLCGFPQPGNKKECVQSTCSSAWYYTEWSGKCSADCAEGIITRRVQCASPDGYTLSNNNCDTSKMPSSEKQCRSDSKCGGRWFTGPWSECSQACGKGKMTRHVVCIKYDGNRTRIIPNSGCHGDQKPKSEKECSMADCGNTWFVTEWSKCSKACDGGIKTRTVKCMTDTFLPSMDCDTQNRPDDTQTCNNRKCRKHKPNTQGRCSDRYPNCDVVVRAKLCRYPYYQRKCCKSCSGLKRLY
ncbi:A disintegrin and metalloproteinase with thrombospondin motifs 20 [Mactra antiquata]